MLVSGILVARGEEMKLGAPTGARADCVLEV